MAAAGEALISHRPATDMHGKAGKLVMTSRACRRHADSWVTWLQRLVDFTVYRKWMEGRPWASAAGKTENAVRDDDYGPCPKPL